MNLVSAKTFQAASALWSKFSLCACMRAYLRATATCATRFLDHLIRQAPFDLESVQVDGGSESAAEFETACQRRGIALFVLPPRSPQA